MSPRALGLLSAGLADLRQRALEVGAHDVVEERQQVAAHGAQAGSVQRLTSSPGSSAQIVQLAAVGIVLVAGEAVARVVRVRNAMAPRRMSSSVSDALAPPVEQRPPVAGRPGSAGRRRCSTVGATSTVPTGSSTIDAGAKPAPRTSSGTRRSAS